MWREENEKEELVYITSKFDVFTDGALTTTNVSSTVLRFEPADTDLVVEILVYLSI